MQINSFAWEVLPGSFQPACPTSSPRVRSDDPNPAGPSSLLILCSAGPLHRVPVGDSAPTLSGPLSLWSLWGQAALPEQAQVHLASLDSVSHYP